MSRVLVRGLNIAAQLNPSRQNIPEFEQIPALRNRRVVALGCGYLQSMYLLDDGQFLKAGYFFDALSSMRMIRWRKTIPFVFKTLQKMFFFGKILSFTAGDDQLTLLNKGLLSSGNLFRKAVFSHSSAFLISNANEVFGIGENYFGQLGTGNSIASESSFRLVAGFNNQKIIDVACGFQHTVFLTESGVLYGCGKTDYFQIQPECLQKKSDQVVTVTHIEEPTLIWSKSKVIKVACGMKSTLFLTEKKKLYGLGDNSAGECGLNYQQYKSLYQPTEIYFPKNQDIIDIVCGFRHTLILTKQRVYFSGSTENNQNPFTDFIENVGAFVPLNLPCRPIKIFAKFDRSAIITEDGVAYLFGGRDLTNIGGQSSKLQILKGYEFNENSLFGLGFAHTVIYV